MYKLRVYIYIIRGTERACQKSYGFKNLVKLECWQTNFKIKLGTCVFKKSCSTSNLAGVGALFDKFHRFSCSKSRACQLASLPSQTEPSGVKPSRTKWNRPSQASHIIAKQIKPWKQRKAKQKKQTKGNQTKPKQNQQPNQANRAKQATKPSKPSTSLASSSQARASKLNTRNSIKRRSKTSLRWFYGV